VELAAKDVHIAEQDARIAKLEKQATLLLELLGQNSAKSHLPPSSDSPEERRRRKNREEKEKQQRNRGAQKVHQGTNRELLPPEKVNKFVDLFPSECESRGRSLSKAPDLHAKRYQQTEVPPIQPYTTEWRRHEVTCPTCGYRTHAAYDETKIPASPFGPRLMAIMALLTGTYHLGRRKAADLLGDVLGIRVSLGALSAVEARVCVAVQPAVDET
jgi:transposase